MYTKDIHNALNRHIVAKYCKFDARGTVVPNTVTSAPTVEIKMVIFTGSERARCVFWSKETKSVTHTQRKFCNQYHKKPPCRPTIYTWHNDFVEKGSSVLHAKLPSRQCVSDATVEQIRQSFV
jgi:hypothetical protein